MDATSKNAYLQAPSSEKNYVICGPEFGLENIGKRALIIRALYGGKSAGADYWHHVRAAMIEMVSTHAKLTLTFGSDLESLPTVGNTGNMSSCILMTAY